MHFINIHTHHLSSNAETISIYNNRVGKEPFQLDSNFSIGIHPWDIDLIEEQEALKIVKELVLHKNCYAIGECGLDKLDSINFKQQQYVFEKQLQLALENKKPVIIHCVKAFDELLEITTPFREHIPLIVHGFNKSQQLAVDLILKGFYLSLNQMLLSKTSFDFKSLPINKLFLETDDKIDTTIDLLYTQLALKLNMSLIQLKEEINRNFETVFYDTER
jgi:TatD DNase family protein